MTALAASRIEGYAVIRGKRQKNITVYPTSFDADYYGRATATLHGWNKYRVEPVTIVFKKEKCMNESLMDYNANCTEEQKTAIELLRNAFKVAEEQVSMSCPNSRRKSEAITHLETGLMFAVKSVAQGK